jgi:hypothetical protein
LRPCELALDEGAAIESRRSEDRGQRTEARGQRTEALAALFDFEDHSIEQDAIEVKT